MSSEGQEENGNTKAKCQRCGDLFYHPKMLIEDARQHAAEWEEYAKRYEKERDELQRKLEFSIEDHKRTVLKLTEEIKQAESGKKELQRKLDEAQKEIEDQCRINGKGQQRELKLETELKYALEREARFKQALEFYADKKNWQGNSVAADLGETARQALEE